MRVQEIGSEFWTNTIADSQEKRIVKFDERNRGFLCGRTALEYIVRDAMADMEFESVLLPSYCCHTMIEPFVRNHIKVRFYSVVMTKEGLRCILPEKEENEALYLMPYFGFGELELYQLEQARKWKFCILDETHSCMSGYQIDYSNWNICYSYTSYRKWADIKGFAMARKIGTDFKLSYLEKTHTSYFKLKNEACEQKKRYIETGAGNKEVFLNLYSEAEELLETGYKSYTALPEGIQTYERMDMEAMIEKRRKNGEYLIKSLKELPDICLMFGNMREKDCPLFIPVLVEAGIRDDLRKYLIGHDIYCPVHWPVSDYHRLQAGEENLYRQELSIICDQRYELSDMKRIIEVIQRFFDEKKRMI